MTETPSPIYLLLPQHADSEFISVRLSALLAQVPVSAVLHWAGADRAEEAELSATIAHQHGAAFFLAGPIAATSLSQADGVHLEEKPAALKAAMQVHAPQHMVGAGGLWNRHDAMQAGETGVDYVLFGSADPARSLDHDRIYDLCGWWSELFEIPCVGAAATLADAEHLISGGADFVALRDAVWTGGSDAVTALRAMAKGRAEKKR